MEGGDRSLGWGPKRARQEVTLEPCVSALSSRRAGARRSRANGSSVRRGEGVMISYAGCNFAKLAISFFVPTDAKRTVTL